MAYKGNELPNRIQKQLVPSTQSPEKSPHFELLISASS